MKRDSTFFDQQQPNNEMNAPTPTPRTDAATYPADCLGATLVTNRDLACTLERELVALTAERDQIRGDCENETKWAAHYLAQSIADKARAERADADAERYRLVTLRQDAELTTERARLDAVIYDCWIIHKGNENAYAVRSLGEYITPWVATPRAAIDAAMKEGEK